MGFFPRLIFLRPSVSPTIIFALRFSTPISRFHAPFRNPVLFVTLLRSGSSISAPPPPRSGEIRNNLVSCSQLRADHVDGRMDRFRVGVVRGLVGGHGPGRRATLHQQLDRARVPRPDRGPRGGQRPRHAVRRAGNVSSIAVRSVVPSPPFPLQRRPFPMPGPIDGFGRLPSIDARRNDPNRFIYTSRGRI